MAKIRTASYYLYDEHLGDGQVIPYSRHAGLGFSRSIAYFCPDCITIWGRIKVQLEPYLPIVRRCEEHGKGFLCTWEPEFFPIPKRVLSREIGLIASLLNPEEYDFLLLSMSEN